MANPIEIAKESLRQTKEVAKGVVSSRWSTGAVFSSLVALGALYPVDTAIAQPVLSTYGIGACSPHGDDWRADRHRDIGFIFEGNQYNPVLSVGRALTITDVREGRMVVNSFQKAGSRAASWTTLTHGGAASIFPGTEPVIFRDGQLYAAELWETNDLGSIQIGGNATAIVFFGGCEPLNQPQ